VSSFPSRTQCYQVNAQEPIAQVIAETEESCGYGLRAIFPVSQALDPFVYLLMQVQDFRCPKGFCCKNLTRLAKGLGEPWVKGC
jgi:hypothetical protein